MMTTAPQRGGSPTKLTRVLIADDHAIVREGVRSLIASDPGFVVIGEAANAEDAWRQACELHPDLLILDVSMGAVSGVDAAERIIKDCPDVKIIVLTMHEERGYVTRMFRAGVAGYVLKRTATVELTRAMHAVLRDELYVDSSLARAMVIHDLILPSRGGGVSKDRSETLTAREHDVLRLVARGFSNKEISAALDIGVKTVETHKANGMTKLGVANRAALVDYAMSEGWLAGPAR